MLSALSQPSPSAQLQTLIQPCFPTTMTQTKMGPGGPRALGLTSNGCHCTLCSPQTVTVAPRQTQGCSPSLVGDG